MKRIEHNSLFYNIIFHFLYFKINIKFCSANANADAEVPMPKFPNGWENILIQRFASDERHTEELDVVQLCLRGKTKKLNYHVQA